MAPKPEQIRRGQPFVNGQRVPMGYATLTIADGAVHSLPACPTNDAGRPELTVVRVRCAANASGGVAWRDDGTDPTATDGMPAEHQTEEDFFIDPTLLKFVRLTADTVVLHVSYYY